MMKAMLGDMFLQGVLAFIGVGCVISLLLGIAMLVRPHIVLQLNDFVGKWADTAKFVHPLDRIFRIERFVYRHHKAAGLLIVGGALFILYFFLFNFDQKATISLLAQSMSRWLAAWLLEAMVTTLVLGSVFAAIVGSFLLIRPSLMRGFETAANRWRATDETIMRLEVMRDFPDRFIARHIRGIGVLVVISSLYALSVFGIFLL